MSELLAGRYRLHEPLGEGGVATVYRAEDVVEGRWCAVKVVRLAGAHRETLTLRMEREAELLTSLAHANIVRVFHAGHDGVGPWMAMELVSGGSLGDQVTESGALSPKRALQVVLQVLNGLSAVHALGIVHRDVKPDNILLAGDGTCKLADFGIALVDDHTRNTAAGFAMGSLPYMAPEQRVDAHAVDHRVDVYAAGATLYYLLTGSTPVDLFLSAPSSPRFSGLPEGLVELIRRATHADPQQRFPDARAMAAALHGCLAMASEEVPSSVPSAVYAPSEGAERVLTAVVPDGEPSSDVSGVERLEAQLRREWLDEDVRARQRSSRRLARLSVAAGVTLLGIVVAVGGRVSLDDWIERQERRQIALRVPITGTWRGTIGTQEGVMVLRGSKQLLTGRFVWKGDEGGRVHEVRGVMDQGLLVLEGPDGSRYRALLEVGGRLDGDYISVTNTEPFHLVRVHEREP